MEHSARRRPTTEWIKIGEVDIDSAAFAILDPGMAKAFSEDWLEDLSGDDEEVRLLGGTFDEVECVGEDETVPTRVMLVRTFADGIYPVEARFCDKLGDGSLEACEVRIDTHGHGRPTDDD
jgi:hypothetical protein